MKTHTRTIEIREDTGFKELIGIKREWVHPQRYLYKDSLYYDIAILELGKKNSTNEIHFYIFCALWSSP